MLIINRENGDIEEILLLIKFQTEANIKKLQSGDIYTNNLKYFIDLERESGQVGIGDKDEATLLISNITDLKFSDLETGEDIQIEKAILGELGRKVCLGKTDARIQVEDYTKTPVLCLLGINKQELNVVDGNLVLKFDDDKINKIKKEFKGYTHALIIEPASFAKRIIDTAKTKGINAEMDYIKYYNPNINQSERINDYGSIRRAFWKKEYFKSQKEFRIAFDNIFIEHGQILINIGDISDISIMLDVETLLNKKFELKVHR